MGKSRGLPHFVSSETISLFKVLSRPVSKISSFFNINFLVLRSDINERSKKEWTTFCCWFDGVGFWNLPLLASGKDYDLFLWCFASKVKTATNAFLQQIVSYWIKMPPRIFFGEVLAPVAMHLGVMLNALIFSVCCALKRFWNLE